MRFIIIPEYGAPMKPAIRTQADERQEEFSAEAEISFEGTEDLTRQEYAQDADINYILSRFGVSGHLPQQLNPQYGETDYSMDLQTAVSAVDMAKRAYTRMPPELKEIYPDWKALLNAPDGEYKAALGKIKAREERRQEKAAEAAAAKKKAAAEISTAARTDTKN